MARPSRLAEEPESMQDEDRLDREDIDDGESEEVDGLDDIYHALRDGDEKMVHIALGLAQCLQRMAHSAARNDDEGLDHWHQQCRRILNTGAGEEAGD